ncbi:hypothetical protein DFJ74DRAFT_767433 [Hyaloraphidium curvatum]|nr:hypothetical protein DFJ74DRAFT_767433 [Hyaloraphidium curvatum]
MKLYTALALGAAALFALASLSAAQTVASGTGTGTGSGTGSGVGGSGGSGCTCDGWTTVSVDRTVTYNPACGGDNVCKTILCLAFSGPTVPSCGLARASASYFQFPWPLSTLPTIESGPATVEIKDGNLKFDISSSVGTSGFTVCFSVPGVYDVHKTSGPIQIHAGEGTTLCTNPNIPLVPYGPDLGCPPCRSRGCSIDGGCTATPTSVNSPTQTFDCTVSGGCASYTCFTPAGCTRSIPCTRSGTVGCSGGCNEAASPVTSGGACTPVCGVYTGNCHCLNTAPSTMVAAVSVVWGSYTTGCGTTSGGPCTCSRTDFPVPPIMTTCTAANQACSADAAVTARKRVKAREL